jgi:hypothetical protein
MYVIYSTDVVHNQYQHWNLFSSSSEDRIRNGAKKLAKARTTTQQGRLDSFFTISHTVTATIPTTKKAVRIHFSQLM